MISRSIFTVETAERTDGEIRYKEHDIVFTQNILYRKLQSLLQANIM